VLHTPGHAPGHLCFWERNTGYLFTGDLVYKDTLFANYPSTDPQEYLVSLKRILALPTKRIFPGHHSLDIQPEILHRIKEELESLNIDGKLHHGSGIYDFGDWGISL
ncbi:MAG: MBL fold metallo-hydrolase, partial [Longicatena sp.]